MDGKEGEKVMQVLTKELGVETQQSRPELSAFAQLRGDIRGPTAPRGPNDLPAHCDLTISHPEIDMISFAHFDRFLAHAARERDLSCVLIHQGVVHEVAHRLASGRMRIGFHLDYYAVWNRADDPYARLSEAVQDAGGRSINAPARARIFTDKSMTHAELVRRGLGAPPTVIVRPWAPDRCLTLGERLTLGLEEPGARLYIKPANGFGGHGVIRLENTADESILAALTAVRQRDRQESYLLQREIRSPLLRCEDGVDRPAYWRVLYCLGEWLPFWWSPPDRQGREPTLARPSYAPVTTAELRRHRLQPILDYARALQELSGLDWFSTELCLSDGDEPSIYSVPGSDGRERSVLAIDYLNDQCAVDVQSRWVGALPDWAVWLLAQRFADEAWRCRQETIRPVAVGYRVAA
jgi:hypothetical protein